MKTLALLVALLIISGCDGGFRVRGTIQSAAKTPLRDCTVALHAPTGSLLCCDGPFTPPIINTMYTVAPTKIEYSLVVACADRIPYQRRFTYGTDVSPEKPLDLGMITLEAANK